MRLISFLILASCIGVLSFQTASAQFPKIKIPKPKTQPAPTETSQPAASGDAQPSQPQPDTRETVKSGTSVGNSAAQESQPTIAKDSVQVFTANISGSLDAPKDKQLKWKPGISFRVNGPIAS